MIQWELFFCLLIRCQQGKLLSFSFDIFSLSHGWIHKTYFYSTKSWRTMTGKLEEKHDQFGHRGSKHLNTCLGIQLGLSLDILKNLLASLKKLTEASDLLYNIKRGKLNQVLTMTLLAERHVLQKKWQSKGEGKEEPYKKRWSLRLLWDYVKLRILHECCFLKKSVSSPTTEAFAHPPSWCRTEWELGLILTKYETTGKRKDSSRLP